MTTRDGIGKVTDTIFFDKSVRLFAFQFGQSDEGRDIGTEIGRACGRASRSPCLCF